MRQTTISELHSLGKKGGDVQLSKYLIDKSWDLESERLVVKDAFTAQEKSLLFLSDEDVEFLQSVLPNDTSALRHNTCAFVGNSVSLLLDDRGSEIDRHQAVMRFIDSTSTKFDSFVGRKRTYLSVTNKYIEDFVPESTYDNAKRPRSKTLLVYGDIPVQDYAQLRISQPDVQAYYLSPVFDLKIRKMYKGILSRMKNVGETVDTNFERMPHALPSLFFMKSICKIVFVYGFTVPIATEHTHSAANTYYGQAKSDSESAHVQAMQYILRLLMLEGHIELVS